MYGYYIGTGILPNCKKGRYSLKLSDILLLIVYLISACNPIPSMEYYENSIYGISLEKPENWDLTYLERSGTILLEAETGFWNKDSARIEITGSPCGYNPPFSIKSSPEEIEANIDRIRKLYYLDSITIVQEPTIVETGDYEVTKAVITIPTMALPENSSRNQAGGQGPDLYQTIDIFAISGGDINSVMAYVYKGNSEALNAQAQEIIDSIQRTCVIEP